MRGVQQDVPAVRGDGPRVHFVAFDGGGAGRHRSFYPAQALRDAGWSVTADVRERYPAPGSCDVLVVHRPLPMHQKIRDAHRRAGAIVLVQEDDDLRAIPPTFDRNHLPTQELIENYERGVECSDGLIVSTLALAAILGPLAPRCWIARNYLPAWVSKQAPEMRTSQLRVGWAGISSTHRHDLAWFRPVASRALAGAMLTLVGEPQIGGMINARCPVERYRYEWDDRRFYRLMGRADIGIVPLDPDEGLNESKSWLKQLEYTMLGRPSVVVDVGEQSTLAEMTGSALVARDAGEFAECVQRLVHDHELRRSMGQSARDATPALAIDAHVKEWEAVLTEAVG
jgi:hypothetical protein